VQAKTSEAVLANWAKLKAVEKAEKGRKGALDGIPRSAPALVRATRAGDKASAVGFDWPDAAGVREKVNEELAELDQACQTGDRGQMMHELGDTLFALSNLARKLGLDAENALREATDRFARRFGHIEETLAAEGRTVASATMDELERLWQAANACRALMSRVPEGEECEFHHGLTVPCCFRRGRDETTWAEPPGSGRHQDPGTAPLPGIRSRRFSPGSRPT